MTKFLTNKSSLLLSFMLAAIIASLPEMAFAQTAAQGISTWLSRPLCLAIQIADSNIAIGIASIAIIVVAAGSLFGQFQVGMVLKMCLGLAAIVIAGQIAELLFEGDCEAARTAEPPT